MPERNPIDALREFLQKEKAIEIAYLFGSHAAKRYTSLSDVDIAVLLSKLPSDLLGYQLRLIDKATELLNADVDLVILNLVPPFLRHQVIKKGKVLYCRDEGSRIAFESRTADEYLDFKRVLRRYNECLLKSISP